MSFPSSKHTQHLPDTQSSQAQQSTSRASRPARRGLPPISTQHSSAANSPATRHILSRDSSASSTPSVLSPTQQQQQRAFSSGVTSTPTSATLPPAPQSGGRRFARSSQQPHSVVASPVLAQSSSAPSGQLTSLVVTQLNILLSTLKDDKKWEIQAEKIQKVSATSDQLVSCIMTDSTAVGGCARNGRVDNIFQAAVAEQCSFDLLIKPKCPALSDRQRQLPAARQRDAEIDPPAFASCKDRRCSRHQHRWRPLQRLRPVDLHGPLQTRSYRKGHSSAGLQGRLEARHKDKGYLFRHISTKLHC
jgi:hypothetical protein